MVIVARNGRLERYETEGPPTPALLQELVGARRLEEVPLPAHPLRDTAVIAYCAANALGREANVRVPILPAPVRGPMVIVGLVGEGHRSLTEEEAAAYELVDIGDGGVPTLQHRS